MEDFACKPEIRVPQSVVFSQPGANVTLGCFISGSPVPEAKWVLKVGRASQEQFDSYRVSKSLVREIRHDSRTECSLHIGRGAAVSAKAEEVGEVAYMTSAHR